MEITEFNKSEKYKESGKIIVVSKEELPLIFNKKGDKEILETFKLITSNKITDLGGTYIATFNFLNNKSDANYPKVEKIGLYTDFKNFSIYFSNNKEDLLEMIKGVVQNATSHAGALLELISYLTENDYEKLEAIEMELSSFDDKLFNNKFTGNATRKISYHRKNLVRYKQHYEQLNLIIDFFEAKGNLIETEEEQENYKILARRIPKLFKEIQGLRDVVVEIRENYHSQIAIKQNNLMKIFTLITAIFMPLQLIVGWYGMNLIMPEYTWKWSYLVIIGVSVAVVIGLIVVFRKRKWFK